MFRRQQNAAQQASNSPQQPQAEMTEETLSQVFSEAQRTSRRSVIDLPSLINIFQEKSSRELRQLADGADNLSLDQCLARVIILVLQTNVTMSSSGAQEELDRAFRQSLRNSTR